MSTPVAIITGAAAGIGAAMVTRFLQDGYRVVAVDRATDPQDRAPCDNYRYLQADLAEKSSAQLIITFTQNNFGDADVLINNAGIGGAKAVDQTDDESWDHILNVNLGSVFRLSKAVLPRMIARGSGSIVHITSVFGLIGFRTTSAYAASKAAIAGLTQQMTVDYGPKGIRVNAIAPGLIETAMTEKLLQDPTYRDLMLNGTPLARTGKPYEVAAAAAFLCSADASFINGQILGVDGGWLGTRMKAGV